MSVQLARQDSVFVAHSPLTQDEVRQQISLIVTCIVELFRQAAEKRASQLGALPVLEAACLEAGGRKAPRRKALTKSAPEITAMQRRHSDAGRFQPQLPSVTSGTAVMRREADPRSTDPMVSGPNILPLPVAAPGRSAVALPALPRRSVPVDQLKRCADQKALTDEIAKYLGKGSAFSPEQKRDLVVKLLNGEITALDRRPKGAEIVKAYNWEEIAAICGKALEYPAGQGHGNVFYIAGTSFAVKRNLPNTELGVYRELDFYDRAAKEWNKAKAAGQDSAAAVKAIYQDALKGKTFIKKDINQSGSDLRVDYTFDDGRRLDQGAAHEMLNKKLGLHNRASAIVENSEKSKADKVGELKELLGSENPELLGKFEKRLASRWRTVSGAMSFVVDRLQEEARKAGVYRPNIPQEHEFLKVIEQLADLRKDGKAAYRAAQVHETTSGDAFVVMHNSLYDDNGEKINDYADYTGGKDGKNVMRSANLLDVKIGKQGASSGEQKYNAMAADTAQKATIGQKLSNLFKKIRVAKNHATTEDREVAVVGKKGIVLDGRELSSGGRSSANETRNIIAAYAQKMNTDQRKFVLAQLERIIEEAKVLPLGFIGSSVVITLPRDATKMPGVMPIDYAHPVSQWDADDRLDNSEMASSRTIPGMLGTEKFADIKSNYVAGLESILHLFRVESGLLDIRGSRRPVLVSQDSSSPLRRAD